jgi:ubiquinone/menaquinone biosynthesis C-methylase UbiE
MRINSYKKTGDYSKINYNKPKYLFITIAKKISSFLRKNIRSKGLRLLDVGGASGAFVYYLRGRFKEFEFSVLEYDRELIKIGRANVDKCLFIHGDANNMKMIPQDFYDITTCLGVICIFDDFTKCVNELVRVTKRSGMVIIVTLVNDYPIDCLIRYRYANKISQRWNSGLNLFSRESLEDCFRSIKKIKSFSFDNFVLPFDLPKQKDPIRTWTEKRGGKRVLLNGIMPIDLKIITLKL